MKVVFADVALVAGTQTSFANLGGFNPGTGPVSPRPQLIGTGADDTLTGTAAANTMVGRADNDTIRSLGGNDTVMGSQGDDRIDGGTGNDRLAGGMATDILTGGLGGIPSCSLSATGSPISMTRRATRSPLTRPFDLGNAFDFGYQTGFDFV